MTLGEPPSSCNRTTMKAKMLPSFLKWLLFVAVELVIATAATVGWLVAGLTWPERSYLSKSPSSAAECAGMRPGMSREEVLTRIHHTTPPRQEYEKGGQLQFSRKDGTCSVELGPDGRVARSRFEKSGLWE